VKQNFLEIKLGSSSSKEHGA